MPAARLLFLVAAAFNIAAVVIFVVAERPLRELLGPAMTENPVARQLAMWSVLVFGLGYLWIARDPTRNHGLIGIAAIGKVGFVTIAFVNALVGSVPFALALVLLPDLVFALLFALFLRSARSRNTPDRAPS